MSTTHPMHPKRRKRGTRLLPTRLILIPHSQTQRIAEFMEQERAREGKHDLDLNDYSPILVYVEEQDDHLHLKLQVHDRTTVQDLRQAAPLVVALQARLLEFQGPWVKEGDTRLFEGLCRDKEAGHSWASLAATINALVGFHLVDWVDYQRKLKDAAPQFKTARDFLNWAVDQPGSWYSYEQAKDLLRAMKLPDSEGDDICREAIKNISNGIAPFYPHKRDYPFDKDEVRTTLQSYLKSDLHRTYKQITESTPTPSAPEDTL